MRRHRGHCELSLPPPLPPFSWPHFSQFDLTSQQHRRICSYFTQFLWHRMASHRIVCLKIFYFNLDRLPSEKSNDEIMFYDFIMRNNKQKKSLCAQCSKMLPFFHFGKTCSICTALILHKFKFSQGYGAHIESILYVSCAHPLFAWAPLFK